MIRLCRESLYTYLGRSFRHAVFEVIYQTSQSGCWYNKPGHIGTLSTDVSEEDTKVYGEHSAIWGNSNCDRKEVSRWHSRRFYRRQ